MRIRVISLALFLGVVVSSSSLLYRTSARTEPAAEKSPVLRALEEELQRDKQMLTQKGDPAPYFMGYKVNDVKTSIAVASETTMQYLSSAAWALLAVATIAANVNRRKNVILAEKTARMALLPWAESWIGKRCYALTIYCNSGEVKRRSSSRLRLGGIRCDCNCP